MKANCWKITTSLDELKEGLFGQVILWTFEILPYLVKKSIFPVWDIKSRLYGIEPEYTVIPGVFDLVYTPTDQTNKLVKLLALRAGHTSFLGGDWRSLHVLWHTFFKVPDRINVAADQIGIPKSTLGLHYRGTDKNLSLWDTNPVSQNDFLTLVQRFLKDHQDIKTIFIATDDFSFVHNARQKFAQIEVINLGDTGFHKASHGVPKKADRALLDCVLLSRCRWVLKCSSALSAFAKVLNPELEIYRISASKIFTDIPYAPEAYVPKWTSSDPECRKILEKLFVDDWLDHPMISQQFGSTLQTRYRYTTYNRFRNKLTFFIKHSVLPVNLRGK